LMTQSDIISSQLSSWACKNGCLCTMNKIINVWS
jgi:hypothetical protein